MRSLFLMTMCLIVFLLSCGGGGSELQQILNPPPRLIGNLEITVYREYAHWAGDDRPPTTAGGIEVGIWASQTELLYSGKTDSAGMWGTYNLTVGDYLVTIRGEEESNDEDWYRYFPNDEWFPVTVREHETTLFSYTLEWRQKDD
ncbi:hypothetical protein J7K50_04355 [bacterium]|nr:hypothetical protein [bacterium]